MSALGQKQTSQGISRMSALPPKADIGTGPRYQLRRDNSGSLAIFAAIRRASSFVSSLVPDRRPSSQMSESDGLAMLAMKTQQVAERDHGGAAPGRQQH